MVDVKVLQGKILFWAERSEGQKEEFFEANPKGLTLTAAAERATFAALFSFWGITGVRSIRNTYKHVLSTGGAEAMRAERRSWLERRAALRAAARAEV